MKTDWVMGARYLGAGVRERNDQQQGYSTGMSTCGSAMPATRKLGTAEAWSCVVLLALEIRVGGRRELLDVVIEFSEAESPLAQFSEVPEGSWAVRNRALYFPRSFRRESRSDGGSPSVPWLLPVSSVVKRLCVLYD
jgi:hypothetical protein